MKKVFFETEKDEIADSDEEIFSQNEEIFSRRKRFLPKLRGMKNEIMKFSKIWIFSLCQIIFKPKIFFFLEKYIFKFHLQKFGNPQKFHDFVFHSPGFERTCFGREFGEHHLFFIPKGLSGKC